MANARQRAKNAKRMQQHQTPAQQTSQRELSPYERARQQKNETPAQRMDDKRAGKRRANKLKEDLKQAEDLRREDELDNQQGDNNPQSGWEKRKRFFAEIDYEVLNFASANRIISAGRSRGNGRGLNSSVVWDWLPPRQIKSSTTFNEAMDDMLQSLYELDDSMEGASGAIDAYFTNPVAIPQMSKWERRINDFENR